MRSAPLFLTAVLWLGACASGDEKPGQPTWPLAFGCSDLVVIGRVETLSQEQIEASPLGSSLWSIEVRVSKIVRGVEKGRIIPARFLSHAQIRSDTDLLLVMGKPDGMGYVITSLGVLAEKPVLAAHCGGQQHY